MYDWPELQGAYDLWWEGLRSYMAGQGLRPPARLFRFENSNALWLHEDLFLSQTCGYPLATELAGKVSYVSTPIYDAEGCEGGYYSSAIIMAKGNGLDVLDPSCQRFAYNGLISQSGYRCMFEHLGDPDSLFSKMICSGSHRNSAAMVANREADVAAIDAVCLALLARFDPQIYQAIKVVSFTRLKPALPFITALRHPPKMVGLMADMLQQYQISDTGMALSRDLLIRGFTRLDIKHYHALAG